MQSQIIEVAGGVTTKGHYDEHTDTLIVQRTADVTANIDGTGIVNAPLPPPARSIENAV